MGKPTDKVWLHWKTLDHDKNRVICRYCKKSPQQKHATKCKKHTSVCSSAPLNVRKEYTDEIKEKKFISAQIVKQKRGQDEVVDLEINEQNSDQGEMEYSYAENTDSSSQHAVIPIINIAEASCREVTMDDQVNKISAKQHKKLEIAFAKAIVSGNIPFQWAQNHYLKEFFAKLGSGFRPPSRRELSGSILNKLDRDSTAFINQKIECQRNLTVIPDGWQNVRGGSVINIMLGNPKCCIFYESFETGMRT